MRNSKELRMLGWMGLIFCGVTAAVGIQVVRPDSPSVKAKAGPEPRLTMAAIMEMYRQPIQLPPSQPAQPLFQPTQSELDMAFRADVERLEARARRLAVAVLDSARRAGLRDAAIILGR